MLIRYIFQSVFIGSLVGIVISAYRFALVQAERFAVVCFERLQNDFMLLPLSVIALFVIGRAIGYLISKTPEIGGGGILYVRRALQGTVTHNNPWLILINKFMAGVLAIASGLFLGKVGPSIQLGVCLGQGTNKAFNTDPKYQKDMLVNSASASLTTAMSAPLAGLTYSFEGLLGSFSWRTLLLCIPGTVAAYLISIIFFGTNPIINMPAFNLFKWYELFQLVILACIIGIIGFIFERFLIAFHSFYENYTARAARPMVPLAFALLFAAYFPAVLGTGASTLALISLDSSLKFLLLLFVCKTFFLLIAFSSGIPGGMFFPAIIVGSLLGAVTAKFAILHMGIAEMFFVNIVLVSMAGFFAAVMHAPLTAVILVCELTLSVNNLVPMIIVCPIAYYLDKLLRSVYEKLQANNRI